MFLTKPAPFDEAAESIAGLAPVDRDTFANLLPELRDAAITIAGVEGLNTVIKVRDIIAKLPAGGDFEKLKAEIEDELSPWLNPEAASKRATLLLRLHGFRAYAAAGYQQMEATKTAFPFRQYVATMDEKTRHSHRALHGVVLPSDHPFWKNHTGPWAWGCRCEAVPLTRGAAERLKAADAQRDPDKALVLDGPLLQRLEQGSLVRGPSDIYDVRTDAERTGDPNAFEWQPGRAALTLDDIRQRYSPMEMLNFETWARQAKTGDGRELWEALTAGRDVTPAAPAPSPAPASGPAASPAGAARTLASLQADAGNMAAAIAVKDAERLRLTSELVTMPDQDGSEAKVSRVETLLAELTKERAAFNDLVAIPAQERGTFPIEPLKERKLNRKTWQYEEKNAAGPALLKHVKKGAAIVSKWVAPALMRPARVASNRGRAYYSPRTDSIHVGGSTALDVVAHELVHPIESQNPAVLAASRAFLAKRAAGESVMTLRSLTGLSYDLREVAFKDKWTERGGMYYSGKLYSMTGRIEDATATELLTVGIQRLERGAFEFHQEDPDYFWFVISTLQNL